MKEIALPDAPTHAGETAQRIARARSPRRPATGPVRSPGDWRLRAGGVVGGAVQVGAEPAGVNCANDWPAPSWPSTPPRPRRREGPGCQTLREPEPGRRRGRAAGRGRGTPSCRPGRTAVRAAVRRVSCSAVMPRQAVRWAASGTWAADARPIGTQVLDDGCKAPLTDCTKPHADQVIGTVQAPPEMSHKKGNDNAARLCGATFESAWAPDRSRAGRPPPRAV
jgi:hypothetical protein